MAIVSAVKIPKLANIGIGANAGTANPATVEEAKPTRAIPVPLVL